MTCISIHQPGYFPWLGYLEKVNLSDVFVIMDDVQLNDNAFQNRNLFFDSNKGSSYLTIPTQKSGHLHKRIRDLRIVQSGWQRKHAQALQLNYRRTPYFDEVYAAIAPVYQKEYTFLIDVLTDSMQMMFAAFGMPQKTIRQSDLPYTSDASKSALVLSILQSLGYDDDLCYLSGTGAAVYQDNAEFEQQGIALRYQVFTHPVYRQWTNKQDFIPGLSALDMAFNVGLQQMNTYFRNKRDENTRNDLNQV
jgi:hypothetical protein